MFETLKLGYQEFQPTKVYVTQRDEASNLHIMALTESQIDEVILFLLAHKKQVENE